MTKKWFYAGSAFVCLLALAAGFWAVRLYGPIDTAPVGDAVFYTGLARSMADGNGYVLADSSSPRPNLERLPLWPALMAPGLWLFPHAEESTIMRYTAVIIHCVTAVLMVCLAYCLWPDMWIALLAGVAFALYPISLAFLAEGASEPAFVMVSMGGLLLLIRGKGVWAQGVGAMLSGLATLSRANYVVLPLMLAVAALLIAPGLLRQWRRFTVFSIVFMMFPLAWMLRNYAASGSFPILSALEGETLYGGNNAVVATTLDHWGYWVFPNEIPGEVPKRQLQARMGDAGISQYYHRRAVQFFERNWTSYPRLLLGKLIRGLVPIPWRPLAQSYGLFFCRGLLYAAFLWYAAKGIIRSRIFKIYLLAMFLMVLTTTLIFYGSARFTYPLEIYLIPVCAAGIRENLRTWSGKWYRPGTSAREAAAAD